jgi:hypothetical protein
MSEAVNARITFMQWDEICNSWMAFSLADGSHDGTIYPTRRDAVRYQSNERNYCFFAFKNCPNGITVAEANRFLWYTEKVYEVPGGILPDPDHQFGGPEAFMPTEQYDNLKGLIIP